MIRALSDEEERFSRSPAYQGFIRRRSVRAWFVVGVLVALVFTFIAITSFAPGLVNRALFAEGPFSLAIGFSLLLIVLMALMAVYFVIASNRDYRRLADIQAHGED